MFLAYYNWKENRFHSKSYKSKDIDLCKRDFNILKRSGLPFYYKNGGPFETKRSKSYGLGHGKKVEYDDLPSNIQKVIENLLDDFREDYEEDARKFEFGWNIYESANWFSLWVNCGEDMWENEISFDVFITKDGSDTLIC